MSEPVRVQRSRAKGWKMPFGAIYVGRPSKYGNPWTVEAYWDAGYSGSERVAAEACVEMFRAWMTQTVSAWSGYVPNRATHFPGDSPGVVRTPPDLAPLKGKTLACWCPIGQPCHAEILIELANR